MELLRECCLSEWEAANVPFFFKQWGGRYKKKARQQLNKKSLTDCEKFEIKLGLSQLNRDERISVEDFF